jgi:hypothetical protein
MGDFATRVRGSLEPESSVMGNDDTERENPWITVSKRKRDNTIPRDDGPVVVSINDTEHLHPNSFTNLSLADTKTEEQKQIEGTSLATVPSPPRKKNKKDKVLSFPLKLIKSRYPTIKVKEETINNSVGLVVLSTLTRLIF